jgi:hypothetical protein
MRKGSCYAKEPAVLAAIVAPFAQIGGVMEPREVNGQPGASFRDRTARSSTPWALGILDGRIQAIRPVINPTSSATRGRWRVHRLN